MHDLERLANVEEGDGRIVRYAAENVGSATIPGNSFSSNAGYGVAYNDPTGSETEHVRGWLFRHIQERWLPWSWAIASRYLLPSPPTRPWESPEDYNAAGEAIVRPGTFPSAQRPFPYPWATGSVSGFMLMLDRFSLAWAWGKPPSGPGVLTPVPIPFDQQFPSLPKTGG